MNRFNIFVPPRRGSDDPWFRINKLDVTTSVLVPGLCLIGWILWAVVPKSFDFLLLRPNLVRQGQIWRLVTWPIAGIPGIFAAFGLYMFWQFGSMLESITGRVAFAKYLAWCVIIPAVVATVVGFELGGLQFLGLGLLVAVAIEFPHIRFFFNIPIRVAVGVVLGITVLQFLGERVWDYFAVLASIVAVSVAGLRGLGRGNDLPSWVPGLPITGTGLARSNVGKPGNFSGRSKTQSTGNGNVVSGPWGESGTGSATGAAESGPTSSGSASSSSSPNRLGKALSQTDRVEVDRLLDKIAASGIDSLSNDERGLLDAASKRMRDGSER